MHLIFNIFSESWQLLLDAAPYILFGILMGGLLKVFLSPAYVARHLGQGRFSSVFKAALFGVPLPLCSCGVLPAAAALKKQGANNGATAAFLISTPESGIDSIARQLCPARPDHDRGPAPGRLLSPPWLPGSPKTCCARPGPGWPWLPISPASVDGCCDGIDCPPEQHAAHHTLREKLRAGMRYAFGELWGDLAGWFFSVCCWPGLISALVPETLITGYLSGGISSMLLMLAFGIPLYICATASTPIAAALILKGVSPGAALVFLLAGPATNMATLTVLADLLGKRTTLVYLTAIGVGARALRPGRGLDLRPAGHPGQGRGGTGGGDHALPGPAGLDPADSCPVGQADIGDGPWLVQKRGSAAAAVDSACKEKQNKKIT